MRARVLIAAVVLASATLVGACTSGNVPQQATDPALPDSAEQKVEGMRTWLTKESVARGELLSDVAFTYDGGNRLELDGVNVTFYTATGEQDGTLTGRAGTYDRRLQRLEVRGNVILVRGDGTRLETPQLVYDQARDEIFSDSAFVLENEKGRNTGVGFVTDPQLRQWRTLSNAKGVIPVTVDDP